MLNILPILATNGLNTAVLSTVLAQDSKPSFLIIYTKNNVNDNEYCIHQLPYGRFLWLYLVLKLY